MPKCCQVDGCENPKVPGQGSKLCAEHRSAADIWRRRDRFRIQTCQMTGCEEPKLLGHGHRYCARHFAEGGKRESTQVVRRKRERLYGICHEQFLALLAEQNGLCAICGKGEDSKDGRSLSLDHCHATGRIRGLLCNRCNPLLGYARDDVQVLEKAIQYLNRTSGI